MPGEVGQGKDGLAWTDGHPKILANAPDISAGIGTVVVEQIGAVRPCKESSAYKTCREMVWSGVNLYSAYLISRSIVGDKALAPSEVSADRKVSAPGRNHPLPFALGEATLIGGATLVTLRPSVVSGCCPVKLWVSIESTPASRSP